MSRTTLTAGSNVVIDVGANLDPAGSVSPRDGATQIAVAYQTNDNFQICGLRTNATAPTAGDFIESEQISNLGTIGASSTNPDGLDFSVTVTTLSKSYQIGDIVGEEACPLYFYGGWHYGNTTAGAARCHNAAQHNDATFFDWNGDGTTNVTDGFDQTPGLGTIGSSFTVEEVNPNRRGGRWGLVPIVFRDVTEGQFRGTMNYVFYVSNRLGTFQWIPDRNNNWYFIITDGYIQSVSNTNYVKYAIGPISQTQANPY
jgi:hypothetical protein